MSGRFALMWTHPPLSSTVTPKTPMGKVVCRFPYPLTCDELFLDQVFISFAPSAEIPSANFTTGDDVNKAWRAETKELYIRSRPGCNYTFFVRPTYDSDDFQTFSDFSAALVPDAPGFAAEDGWCRTYKPIRDVPMAKNLERVGELDIELLWPILSGDSRTTLQQLPDYRIERVLCDFSWR